MASWGNDDNETRRAADNQGNYLRVPASASQRNVQRSSSARTLTVNNPLLENTSGPAVQRQSDSGDNQRVAFKRPMSKRKPSNPGARLDPVDEKQALLQNDPEAGSDYSDPELPTSKVQYPPASTKPRLLDEFMVSWK